jgi:hypothetical protein
MKSGFEHEVRIRTDYSISLGNQKFGFVEGTDLLDDGRVLNWSRLFLGPLGSIDAPFTAIQGLVGSCLICALLVALLTVTTVRWKRRAARS